MPDLRSRVAALSARRQTTLLCAIADLVDRHLAGNPDGPHQPNLLDVPPAKRAVTMRPIQFDPDGPCWKYVTPRHLAAWEKAFPGVDVIAELAKAAAYYLNNPTKRKKQWGRALNAWISNQHNWSQPSGRPALPASTEDIDNEMRSLAT